MKRKTFDWLVTAYNKNDKVKAVSVIKDRTEHEAEKEATPIVSGSFDWSMIKMQDAISRHCNDHGQTDSEIATNLGLDEEEDGFSEMVINHDYIWVEAHSVWIPENSRMYDKIDNEVVEYIKSKK